MRPHPLLPALLLALASPAHATTRAQPAGADRDPRDLPLRESRAEHPAGTLAIVLTGDGGFASLVRGVSDALRDAGVDVVGLDMRAYLRDGARTPDQAAADVARVARWYGARWGDARVLLVGYSRGADALPFVASRLPADLRARVALVSMLGLSATASFEFHWSDMVRDEVRAGDLPTRPELERLRGRGAPRLQCIYGVEEKDSGCRAADSTLVARVALSGGHHFDGDGRALGRLVLDALGPAR